MYACFLVSCFFFPCKTKIYPTSPKSLKITIDAAKMRGDAIDQRKFFWRVSSHTGSLGYSP